MPFNFKDYIDTIANVVEFVGVLTIFSGVVYCFFKFIVTYKKKQSNDLHTV